MANISDFKAKLAGGGARANQFKVTMPFPGYASVGGEIEELAFLCRATSIPSMEIANIPVPFRGRSIKIAGDRTIPSWSITVYNDTNFKLRNAFERWSNGINDFDTNLGLNSLSDYATDLTAELLDRDDTVLKTYIFKNAWPKTISGLSLDSANESAIAEFTCTWKYQNYSLSGVNF